MLSLKWFFNYIKPKCLTFWKLGCVSLSLGHLSVLIFFAYSSVLTWKLNTCNANISFSMGILSSIQLCCLYCTVGPTEGLCCSSRITASCFWGKKKKSPLLALFVSQDFYPKWPSDCAYTQQSSAPLVVRVTSLKRANVRDNNLREWAWCSPCNIHWEISLSVLVLYI